MTDCPPLFPSVWRRIRCGLAVPGTGATPTATGLRRAAPHSARACAWTSRVWRAGLAAKVRAPPPELGGRGGGRPAGRREPPEAGGRPACRAAPHRAVLRIIHRAAGHGPAKRASPRCNQQTNATGSVGPSLPGWRSGDGGYSLSL